MIKSSSEFCTEVAFVPNVPEKRASCISGYSWLLLLLMAILAGSCVRVRAQELAGTFTGTVTDSSGAVIQNANISITLNGVNGEPRVAQSSSAGNYTASNLPPGTYTITVSAPNFETFADRDVVLDVAQKRTVNAQLKPGSQSQTVTVEDSPVAVDTESSSQAGTVSGTQVRELALANRNFQQLVTLQPGVVNLLGDQPGFGGLNSVSTISVNGARSSANNWSVDGADINDSGSNTTLLNIPSVDAIQEFTLERSSYDASFGRSGGGRRRRHGAQRSGCIGGVRHRRGDVRAAVIGRFCRLPNASLFLRGGARRGGGFGLVFVRRQEIAELAGGGRQRHGFPRINRVTYRAPPVAFCRCQWMRTQFAPGGAHSV